MTPHHSAGLRRLTAGVALAALLAMALGDLAITTTDPAAELARLAKGLLQPDLFATEYLLEALWATLAFALLGVAGGIVLGAVLVMGYHRLSVRALCALVRSVHELFWALLFMQLFGLSGLTGVLALSLPYGATFARVYAEILARAPPAIEAALPVGASALDRLLYGRLAPMWPALVNYTRYRFECALRSATVLGFIGLPTLGFYLETAFRQGQYAQGGALLWLFLLLIATLRWWLRPPLIPLALGAALWWLPATHWPDGALLWRFVSEDLWPAPLVQGHWGALGPWLGQVSAQAWSGLKGTVAVAAMALAFSWVLALLWWPMASRTLAGHGRWLGQALLLVGRSVPELLLAFILLLLMGPSMLPAALALGLHNGALVAYLTAREADRLTLRPDAPKGLDRHNYELLPRLYPGTVGLLMYRFESMVRETAMVGMLGIATLGFYVDSAFELFRFDQALALILVTALLNLVVESLTRRFAGLR
ncbi:PhnE/PtxC family ABC transporter permease [Ferrimonas balearica]|uniref:PhnE/PtxC family ABC transporter permease n=1 Tax=Ferrimonas balearica TaxID=44012 RepID=UPI001C9967D8|nr:ABC transporter permease [Ferrimonas balearica]MBY5991825.1 ABC transporter permease [Ferrimonas balearica]